jgi:ubiquinone/menaquinone biosynthesis C-methylase UbiE
MSMPNKTEVERLTDVYRSYRESQAIQAQWDEQNPGNQAILKERRDTVRRVLDSHGFLPLDGRKALEVGCGSGKVLASLLEFGAKTEDLYGVDLLPDRIDDGRKRYPGIHFWCANAEQMDFPDGTFDLIILSTVFSSILDGVMARNVAAEVYRLLKPGGAVLWYDFRYNNPRNANVRGMTKSHIKTLFPELTMYLHTITLLPPLARLLGRLTPVVYPALCTIPILRTHYLGLLIKST